NLSNWRVQDQLRKRQAPTAPRPIRRGNDDWPERESRTAMIERVPDPAGAELENIWEKEWQATVLDAALARVKAQTDLKQWQRFDLYALKEWSARDVAKALGVSAGRVYLAKHRVSALVKKE